jgi:glycosyltransferase involved in cell wall biosynthesis
MKRALFIAARDDLYGASRALLAHLARLPSHGFEQLALATPADGPLAAFARSLGVSVLIEPSVGSSRSLKTRLTAPFRLKPLMRFATEKKMEMVVAATLSACPAATDIAEKCRLPAVVHLRSTYAARGKADAFVRYEAARATKIVAASRAVLAEYTCTEGQSAVVVHDGIEPPKSFLSRDEARQVLRLPLDAKLACTVGAVSPRKGTAFAANVAHRAGMTLVAFGEGHDEFSPGVRVIRVGFRADVARLLPAFDVFLHPSKDEALGLAPVEAMAAGVPVIASNIGGLPEALGNAAPLIDPRDGDAWLAALAEVLADPDPWIRLGHKRALEMSADESARKVAEVYQSL